MTKVILLGFYCKRLLVVAIFILYILNGETGLTYKLYAEFYNFWKKNSLFLSEKFLGIFQIED